MRLRRTMYRKILNQTVNLTALLSACIGLFFLAWIIVEVMKRGITAFNIDFFTKLPTPPGVEGGGVANAFIGTLVITVISTLIGVPVGILSGVYLSEFGGKSLLGKSVRFTLNVIMGIPSIIVGMFVYTLIVIPIGHFSGFAGSVALAIIIVPVVARTTEDMLNLVPPSLRESALALGAPHWKTTISILFRAAKSGMITGILLATARISGETAPLLFTALNSPYWPSSINQPTANLTVTIFNYAMSPFAEWQQAAWGASLLIMATVLATTLTARYIARESTSWKT